MIIQLVIYVSFHQSDHRTTSNGIRLFLKAWILTFLINLYLSKHAMKCLTLIEHIWYSTSLIQKICIISRRSAYTVWSLLRDFFKQLCNVFMKRLKRAYANKNFLLFFLQVCMCEQEGLNLWQTLRTLPRHHYWPCIEYGLQVFSLSLNDISMQRPRYIILRGNSKFVTVWKFLTNFLVFGPTLTQRWLYPQTSVFLWLLLRQFCKCCDA